MSDLETALLDVAAVFDAAGVRYMVIGGMANAVWGQARATVDIDLTVGLEVDQVPALLSILSSRIRSAPHEPEAFARDTGVLPFVHVSGIRVDLMFGTNAYAMQALDRAVAIKMGDRSVRFCSPEDLILHKLLADRDRDRTDVQGLIRMRKETLDRTYLDTRVQELAEALSRPEILTRYLALVS